MRKTAKILPFFLVLSASVLLLHGVQEEEQQVPPEQHEVEVKLVIVDAIVTEDGQFVKDLSKADFVLYEDGKRVPINSFELISFEERKFRIIKEEEEQEFPEPPKKKLTVLFDSINSWKREVSIQGDRILDELYSLVELGNEVMIGQLHPTQGLDILQSFTSEKSLIEKAVEKASGNVWNLGTDIGTIPPTDDLSQGDPNYYRNMMRQEYLYKERQKFIKTIGGILGTFNMIKELPGRKTILFISAGIPDISPPDILPNPSGNMDPQSRFFGRQNASAAAMRTQIFNIDKNMKIFDPFNILSKKVFTNSGEVIREIINLANAQNISVYSLNSDIFVKHLYSGASAEHYQEYEKELYRPMEKDRISRAQNLRWLSEDTGADSLRGANKFEQFRRVMNTDLTYYYQLSFYPQRTQADDQYHKIRVHVKRRGVDVRHRKGYTDYSSETSSHMELVTAFYNPSLFKRLPFKAQFIPFYSGSAKFEPWMSIALPSKEFFIDRFFEYQPKVYHLHVWIQNKESGERGFGGRINLPLNVNRDFIEYIKTIHHLNFHFKGPELDLKNNTYQAIFALLDPETEEIGAYESSVTLPDLSNSGSGAFINCVLGHMDHSPIKNPDSFRLSQEDGTLQFGNLRFFPKVTNEFKQWGGVCVFLQLYLPQDKPETPPNFFSMGEDNQVKKLHQELLAECYNEDLKVWNAIFFLDISPAPIGRNTLFVEIAGTEEGTVLNSEVNLTVFR
ncbi:MAG: VWA domain-containing protein [Candidatus Aminicenantes bacterium]